MSRRSLFPVILACLLAAGCSSPKMIGSTENNDLNPSISPFPGEEDKLVFPHPKEWVTPSQHGEKALHVGVNVCLRCHQKTEVLKDQPPTCNSCHSLFPHSENWNDPSQHGSFVKQNGSEKFAKPVMERI